MKVFHCDHCGQLLFFENSVCVRCGRALAYVLERRDLASLDFAPTDAAPNRWLSRFPDEPLRLCENYSRYNVCNWAVPFDDLHALCRACRLTRTIPNLSRAGNDRLWYKLEVAKRRLIYTLDQLGLPLESKLEAPDTGLTFEFLEEVLTGHAEGVITVNITEADDAVRVKRRSELNEPYRTLLGHFRHESGHFYWDRLIRGTDRLEAFRARFGDERADYAAALARNYSEGAPPGWQDHYVSAYAAMHPWEDWAETWAHYLHMIDTLETAAACGISIAPPRKDEPTVTDVPNPVADAGVSFDAMMESWTTITYVLDNLNRGLGNDDAYPFVLSAATVAKLRFVHETIAAHAPAPCG
ncbi:MAG: putative zinc-binding metallopeptidase [Labilithrix sp.]|nr:putative zinc-binding metallopeptidase [Labilithrix sp.]MCW5833087.1 putative zinc-binding metallopeptidase [Labilithrix sp.]